MNYTLIVIFDPTKEHVLLMKKNRGPYPGKLNHPGGKVEDNETYLAGAIRELKEETGIVRTNLDKLVTELFPSGAILHVFYTVLQDNEQFQQLEDEPLNWYSIWPLRSANDPALAGEGNIPYFINAALEALKWLK